jgi:hypothetical protein
LRRRALTGKDRDGDDPPRSMPESGEQNQRARKLLDNPPDS